MSNAPYSAIDLFCGAGGLSTGLRWAGFDIKWATDSNQKAVNTYSSNHDSVSVKTGDIAEQKFPDLDIGKGLDLVAGGPPCPTFSVVGRAKINSIEGQRTATDDRHQLWREFLRAVDHYSPRTFLMENVKGMASAENAAGHPVLPIILEKMRDLGYRVDATVVDAADFGVPQRRERLFIIGNRLDQSNPDLDRWMTHREAKNKQERQAKILSEKLTNNDQKTLEEFATNELSEQTSTERRSNYRRPWVTVAEAILDLPPLSPAGHNSHGPDTSHPPAKVESYQVHPITGYQQWARNIPEGTDWEDQPLRNHSARFHNIDDLSIYKMLGEGTGWTIGDLDEDIQPYRADVFEDNYTKQSPTQPASTIDAHLHKDGHRHVHPSEARSLTVREAARLQSFKDTYSFPVSRTAAYRQVGNAVPPLLAESIGKAIIEGLLD